MSESGEHIYTHLGELSCNVASRFAVLLVDILLEAPAKKLNRLMTEISEPTVYLDTK